MLSGALSSFFSVLGMSDSIFSIDVSTPETARRDSRGEPLTRLGTESEAVTPAARYLDVAHGEAEDGMPAQRADCEVGVQILLRVLGYLGAREGAQRIHLVIGDASAASDEENQQYEKYEPAAPSRARFLFFFIYIFDGFRVLVLFCAVLQDDHPVTPRLRAASAARARHILVSRRYSETR